VWRLDLRDPRAEFEPAADWVYGSYSMTASVVPAHDSGVWIGLADPDDRSSLLHVGPGRVRIGVLASRVDYSLLIDEYGQLSAPSRAWFDRRRDIPARAVFDDGESLWLMGVEGIARMKDGVVEPVLAFEPIPRPDWHPHALARFADGTFLVGDTYSGLFRIAPQGLNYVVTSLVPPELNPSPFPAL
jgi:hypothetical protein